MEPATILIIVNIIVTAAVVPLTLGVVDVMKRLRKSDCCCGVHLELDRANSNADLAKLTHGLNDNSVKKLSDINNIQPQK